MVVSGVLIRHNGLGTSLPVIGELRRLLTSCWLEASAGDHRTSYVTTMNSFAMSDRGNAASKRCTYTNRTEESMVVQVGNVRRHDGDLTHGRLGSALWGDVAQTLRCRLQPPNKVDGVTNYG